MRAMTEILRCARSWRGRSMIEHELGAIEESPEHVGERFLRIAPGAAAFHITNQPLALFGARLAAQSLEIQGLDAAWRRHERRLDNSQKRFAVLQILQASLLLDELAVHERQGLENRGVIFRAPVLAGEL